MLTETDMRPRGLADLPDVETDSLLQLIALCNADPRPEKIDVGVGVYRDSEGRTPILPVIKEAERILGALRQPFEILGNQAHVGVSIGVALAPEDGKDRTELMRKDEIAL